MQKNSCLFSTEHFLKKCLLLQPSLNEIVRNEPVCADFGRLLEQYNNMIVDNRMTRCEYVKF